jgi:large subunit ribosomal protein L32
MPVQKQRHSKLRRKRGRVGDKVVPKKTQTCPKCNAPVLAHTVCPKCGFYKGKEFVNTLKKTASKKQK